jgi:chromosome segregation protein
MKIKEIKLYGFKSFCDETRILLNTGITAFVGPNGSGKSNIFDALRWIFGEQSMKALRCDKMEDLVYESVDSKNDASFTDVSVIIENEDYFPQFGSEFEIRRRFYKSGESEFFLNRVKCRLQDIQALFLNSGTLTYSFLELAEIEKIIHGDTKEMFDDVSGILKYRERREQTKRRLEATEQDLIRLEDIISEMQRGLRSLKRQVRQTRLYQELKEEYKTLSLYIIKNQYNTTLQELARVQMQTNNQESQRQAVLQQIKKLENDREILKKEMAQIEITKKETLSHIAAIDDTIRDIQNRIEAKNEEAKQITLSCERMLASIKEKEEILHNNTKRLSDSRHTHEEIVHKISQLNVTVSNERKQLEEKNRQYFSLKENLKQREEILTVLLSKIQSSKNETAKLQFEKENKETILSRILDEHNAHNQEFDSKVRLKKDIEDQLDTVIKQQGEAVTRLEQINRKLSDFNDTLRELETDLQKRQEEITDCKVIIDTLNHRLKEKGSNKEIEKRFSNKTRGLLRNNLEVAEGYESVIDICLGDLLDFYLLTQFEPHDFENLPDGRFGFISTKTASQKNEVPDVTNDVQPITQFVTFKSKHGMLQEHICNYFLTSDLKSAHELSQKYHNCGFVTRDGMLVRKGIIIIEKGEFGYFKIRESLKQYQANLETLQNELLFIHEEKKRLEEGIEKTKKNIEEEKDKLFTINVTKSEHSLKLHEVSKDIEKMRQESEHLSTDQNTLKKEVESLVEQVHTITETIQNAEQEVQGIQNEKAQLSNTITQMSEEIDEHNSSLNEMTLESVIFEERRNSTEKTIEQLNNENQVIEKEIATLKENTEAKNLAQINEALAALKQNLESKNQEKVEHESQLPEKLSEEFNVRQNTIYDELTEKQKIHEEMQNSIMELKYQLFQLTHKKDEHIRDVQEKFHIDLTNYVPDEVLEAEDKLAQVKGKLEKLGEVNPLSLELYESEKKRLDEFLSQRDDIITAKRNLLKSIDELDQRAQERFIGIFEQVKKEFNYVFSNFFEGGGADLILTDQDNPLTSQIEIVVRMGGKKLKTISQLSGGQRTLLAVSLLLAFYLVKPAPFCILDEIDAPLDDANVVKFNQFLRNLSQRTQVIIITHNRATMEYTDYLYGVTMEKPRQSKIISARLADLEKIGALE